MTPSCSRRPTVPCRRATFAAIFATSLLAATVVLPSASAAQPATTSTPVVPVGTPVRLRVAASTDTLLDGSPASIATVKRSGRLVRVDADSVVLLAGSDTTSIARAKVRAFEARIANGSRRRLVARRAAIGAGLGAASGAILAGVFYEPCDGEWFCYPRSQEMAITGALWSVPGALLGGVAGMFGDTRRWQAMPLPAGTRVSLAVAPRGARMSITF